MSTSNLYETTGAKVRGFSITDEDLGTALHRLADFVDENPDLCLNAVNVNNELESDLLLVWNLFAVFDDMNDSNEEEEVTSPFLELVVRYGATPGS